MAYIGQEPGLGEAERFIFTTTAVTDTVTADDNGVLINYTVGQVSVYLNGVKQVIPTDVAASNGSTVVFASNYAIGDVVEIIALTTFSPADTVPATGGTFTGNVTFSGGIKEQASTNIAGTIADSYLLSLAYVLTGDVTLAGTNVFGKITDGTTNVSITNDGTTRTLSGSGVE